MKTQIKKDLQTKTVAEIKKLLDEAVKAVAQLKLDHQQNKVKNTREIFHKGKEVAVLHSIMKLKKTAEKIEEAVETVVKKAKPSVAKALDGKGGKK